MRLAQSLGGEAVTIPGGDRRIADDVIGYSQANNVTQIIIGKSTRSRWFEILHGSVVHDLVRRSGNISVNVIAGDEIVGEPIPKKTVGAAEGAIRSIRARMSLRSLRSPLALGVSAVIHPWFGIENVDLVFLTAVVGVAVRYGLWPSLFASVAASLCYNFFFLPPIYTFTIARSDQCRGFLLLHRHGGGRVERGGARAHAGGRGDGAARAPPSRFTLFSRKLAGVGTLDDVLWATAYQTASMLKVRVVLLLPENGSIAVKTGYPPEDILDEADLAAAKWAWENNRAGWTRFGYASRCQASVSAHAHRPWRHRRGRHRQRQGRVRFSRPISAACSMP